MTAMPAGFYIDLLIVCVLSGVALFRGFALHALVFTTLTFIDWAILARFDLSGREWSVIWGGLWLFYALYLVAFTKFHLLTLVVAVTALFILSSPVLYYLYSITFYEPLWSAYDIRYNYFHQIWYTIIAAHITILILGGRYDRTYISDTRYNADEPSGGGIPILRTKSKNGTKRK